MKTKYNFHSSFNKRKKARDGMSDYIILVKKELTDDDLNGLDDFGLFYHGVQDFGGGDLYDVLEGSLDGAHEFLQSIGREGLIYDTYYDSEDFEFGEPAERK